MSGPSCDQGARIHVIGAAAGGPPRGLTGAHSDRLHLLERPAGRTVREISACEFERPSAVVAAAGVELRGMVRKGKRVCFKLFKAGSCGIELCLADF